VSLLLPANCLTVASILTNFARYLHIFFGAWHLLRVRHELGLRLAKLAALGVLYMFVRNACGLAGLRPRGIYIYLPAAWHPGGGFMLEARLRALIRAKKWGP